MRGVCANCGRIFELTGDTLAVGPSNELHICRGCVLTSTSRYEVLVLASGRRFRSWKKRPAARPRAVPAVKARKAATA